MTPTLLGIAGGTSSGKTSFAAAIADRLGDERCLLIPMDAYYHDPSHLPVEERARVNYDHPDAYDLDLLIDHLDRLRGGEPVPRLTYDYVRHARVSTGELLKPRPLIILEGILALENARLRERYDIKLFIDTDADVRILRRLGRDVLERGRTLESVTRQYLESVRPMHLEFTEPSKRYADLIIPEGARNRVALDLVTARIEALLEA